MANGGLHVKRTSLALAVAGLSLGLVVQPSQAAVTLTDTTVTDFTTSPASGCYIGNDTGGEVLLSGTLATEFYSAPPGWLTHVWTSGGGATFDGNTVTVSGAVFYPPTAYGPSGVSLEFKATFGAQQFETIGFGGSAPPFNDVPLLAIGTYNSTTDVNALTWPTNTSNVVPIQTIDGLPHRYRIDWGASSVSYWVDGVLKTTQPQTIGVPMTPSSVSSFNLNNLVVDWLRMTPYTSPCTFLSRVFDAGFAGAPWTTLAATAALPSGTTLSFQTRTGDTPTPGGTWSAFAAVSGTTINSPPGQYLQYEVTLNTTDTAQTPELQQVDVSHTLCGNGSVDGGEQCDQGAANGTAGSCCNTDCTFVASGTPCRASAGVCDVAESCTGSSGACPTDGKEASGTACTSDGNPCTLDQCDGVNNACQHPAGNAGALCRPSAGACDVAEACTGSSPACPADGFVASGTTCRPSAGVCDLVEACTGSGPACPADGFVTSGTTCRASAGACDIAETCTGSGPTCPVDAFKPASTICRPVAGDCDVAAESCTGSSPICPPDGNPACPPPPDADGDHIANAVDNCRNDVNTGQEDADADGVGDACDNCPSDFNPFQTDLCTGRQALSTAPSAPLTLKQVRLKAAPNGTIRATGIFDTTELGGAYGLVQALRHRSSASADSAFFRSGDSFAFNVSGAGLAAPGQTFFFPPCLAVVVCRSPDGASASFVRRGATNFFKVSLLASGGTFAPPLSAETVTVTLSLGGSDDRDQASCRALGKGRSVSCRK